jgi:hypothetical protein
MLDIPTWIKGKTDLLIDTNLLAVLVIGRTRETLLGQKPVQEFHVSDFDRLANFTTSFKTISTTPHILAEVNSLLNKTGYARRECRSALASLIILMQESQQRSEELTRDDSFLDHGLTDVSIKSAAKTDTLVLTEDEGLLGVLNQAGIAALRYKDLIDTE